MLLAGTSPIVPVLRFDAVRDCCFFQRDYLQRRFPGTRVLFVRYPAKLSALGRSMDSQARSASVLNALILQFAAEGTVIAGRLSHADSCGFPSVPYLSAVCWPCLLVCEASSPHSLCVSLHQIFSWRRRCSLRRTTREGSLPCT